MNIQVFAINCNEFENPREKTEFAVVTRKQYGYQVWMVCWHEN